MHAELSRILGMFEMARPQRKLSAKTLLRVRECKCLRCDKTATKLGLCRDHYNHFYYSMMSRPSATKRSEYLLRAIRSGKVLAQGQMRKLKRKDFMSEAA